MTTQYPVLVYGTLRPTGGNYERLLEGETTFEQDVTLHGFTMYGQSGCPYLAVGDRTITATFMRIDEERYTEVLKSLDCLEGFRSEGSPLNNYDRILHTFLKDGVETVAWIYVASANLLPDIIRTTTILESGDWIAHVQSMEEESYSW